MVIEDNEVQPSNARIQIKSTEFGISIEVRPIHPEKALTPIDVIE